MTPAPDQSAVSTWKPESLATVQPFPGPHSGHRIFFVNTVRWAHTQYCKCHLHWLRPSPLVPGSSLCLISSSGSNPESTVLTCFSFVHKLWPATSPGVISPQFYLTLENEVKSKYQDEIKNWHLQYTTFFFNLQPRLLLHSCWLPILLSILQVPSQLLSSISSLSTTTVPSPRSFPMMAKVDLASKTSSKEGTPFQIPWKYHWQQGKRWRMRAKSRWKWKPIGHFQMFFLTVFPVYIPSALTSDLCSELHPFAMTTLKFQPYFKPAAAHGTLSAPHRHPSHVPQDLSMRSLRGEYCSSCNTMWLADKSWLVPKPVTHPVTPLH